MARDLPLREFFTAAAPPRHALARLFRGLGGRSPRLEPLADRFRIEASDHGVTRLRPGRGPGAASLRARGPPEQAREELREYPPGRPTFFRGPLDLDGVPAFPATVLAEAATLPV